MAERGDHAGFHRRARADEEEARHGRQQHDGLAEHLPERAAAAGDADPSDLGGQDEPCAAAHEDRDDHEEPGHRAGLRGDDRDEHRREDPDDLLQARVEGEQGVSCREFTIFG